MQRQTYIKETNPYKVNHNKYLIKVYQFTHKRKLKENEEVSRVGAALSSLAYGASIQSQYEQSPRYKYSDPAVVLMSKVYQTTDSIHVETATLPGNSSTNRDRVSVCRSLSEYHYGMSRERGREGERKRGCLSLLIMQHHSLCINPAG